MLTVPIRRRALLAGLGAGLLTPAACGRQSQPDRGSTFAFVSPGGQTRITYDPPGTRGHIGDLSGPGVLDPQRPVAVSDFPGQVVVLNVWGSWCGPCRGEADELERVYAQTKDSGVAFLGINVRDDRSAAQDFVRNFAVTFPSIFDSAGRSLLALAGFPRSVVPATVVLDRRHRVAAIFLTAVLEKDLLPVVQRVASEEPVQP
ncbi:TlpA disulfide reductase family protein [Saccharopolyspora tripterygii]